MHYNILASRKAAHFTKKNSLTELSNRTTGELQNKQTLKKGLFQGSYVGFQIQVSIKLHLCDTQLHTVLLDLTSVMTLHK